jgi:gliding motility-associated-like protein
VTIDTQIGDVDEWVSFADIPAGDYTLLVNDANSCQISTIITIAEPNEVTVSITTTESPTCDPDGTSTAGIIIVEAQGGSDSYIYTIYRNGAYLSDNTDGIFNNLAAGDYYVEVYDTNGCGPATTTTETLTSPTSLQIDNVVVTNVNCYGQLTGELEVIYSDNVGTPLFSIIPGDDNWQTDNTFTDLLAGNYTVRVKDDNFCIVMLEVTINESPQIIITAVPTPPTTSLSSDGSIAVNIAGGTPNYWYELYQDSGNWNMVGNFDDTNLTSHTFIDLGIGSYRIIVRDMFGCEAFVDMSLSQFNVLLTATDVLCHDACDGTITLNALGGIVETLDWTLDGVPYDMEQHLETGGETYINLCAGIYDVTATDTDGVESTTSIEITQPDPIVVTYTVALPDCYTNQPVGIVEFDIQGGTPFAYGYNITWDTGSAQGYKAEELAEGTYIFTITDKNDCVYVTDNIEVEYPEGMIMESFFAYNLTCNNDNSGEITMLVSGGTETITYTIDGPNGTEQNTDGIFNGLPAGEYTISIADDNGCAFIFEGEYSNTVTLTEPDAIIISTLISPIETLECHNDTLDIVEMQVTGGTPGYTYSWDNEQEGLNLIEVIPGNYILTVTDTNGCVASETIVVPGPLPFSISSDVTMAKCRLAPEGNDGKISIENITGGNGVFDIDFNVKWYKTGFGHLENSDGLWTIDELQSGNYYALITDQKGCEENKPFNVTYNTDNDFQVGIDMDSTVYCWGDMANLEAIPVQGTFGSPAIFEWYNLTQNENLQIGGNKSYTTPPLEADQIMLLKVISSQGCLEQRRDTIHVYPQIGPYLIREEHPFFSDSDLIAFRIGDEPDSTVITVLADTEYPIEIRTKAADYTLAYAWDPSEFFSPANNKNSTILFQTGQYEGHETSTLENVITGKDEKYIPLTGTVKSELGCAETIDLKARVLGKVRMSNVFSPNGDGINDLWFVPYADIFTNLEIKVFNRWGAEVWTAKASEATKGWNGKNKNGKDLPTGTYYYVISFNVSGSGKWKPISGSVTIVR